MLTYRTPFGAAAMCRAWPIRSAKILAQKPAGSFRPASFGQAAIGAGAAAGAGAPQAWGQPSTLKKSPKKRREDPFIDCSFWVQDAQARAYNRPALRHIELLFDAPRVLG